MYGQNKNSVIEKLLGVIGECKPEPHANVVMGK
jgi:hypothetical protein